MKNPFKRGGKIDMFFFAIYQFLERIDLQLRLLPASLLNLAGHVLTLPALIRESEIMAEAILMELMEDLSKVKAEYRKKTGKAWSGGSNK
jgi:hypothetical protein